MTKDNHRVLYIARNIPLPNLPENDVILRTASQLSMQWDVSICAPVEWIPRLPGCPGYLAHLANIPSSFEMLGHNISSIRYLRLPGLSFSYAGLMRGAFERQRLMEKAAGHALAHAHYVLPDGGCALAVKRELGIPFVVTVRQGDLAKLARLKTKSFGRSAYDEVLRAAEKIIVPSSALKQELEAYGYSASVVPHAIDLSDVPKRDPTKDGTVRVLTVAKLVEGKNVPWVIRAMASYRGPNAVELTIVGDGPARSICERVARECAASVRFTGQIPRRHVMEHYSRADIFALPSARETFGLVYLEGLASGCTVLGPKHTGVHGLFIEDAEMAFHDPNEAAFTAALHELIDDQPKRHLLSKRGEQKAKKDFTWEAVCSNYGSIYESTIRST